jgi:hypothetical protein
MKKQLSQTKSAIASRAKRAGAKLVQTAIAEVTAQVERAGNGEATDAVIATDAVRSLAQAGNEVAANITAQAGNVAFSEAEDRLTCTESSYAWNRGGNTVPHIELRGANNLLAAFDYQPTPLIVMAGGKEIKTPFHILTCSDDGKVVGRPFNPKTYSLLGNQKFLDVIGQITSQLDKMGLKWEVVTTGTLYNRERQFLTVRILEDSMTTLQLDKNRKFCQFLNCLNSIPSNSGCTVTFANNSFCVCCRNTFSHCLHGADGTEFHVALKHTNGLAANLDDVPKLVECFFASNAALFANLKRFAAVGISTEDAEKYFAAFVGRIEGKNEDLTDKAILSARAANTVETLKGLFVNGKGNEGKTVVDMFQAVTEYYTHLSAGESDNAWKQFQSSEVGTGADAKQSFYSWLVRSMQANSPRGFGAVAKVGDVILVASRKAADGRQAARDAAKIK